jgi:hypothetical protein
VLNSMGPTVLLIYYISEFCIYAFWILFIYVHSVVLEMKIVDHKHSMKTDEAC